jgi:hypothetical protein
MLSKAFQDGKCAITDIIKVAGDLQEWISRRNITLLTFNLVPDESFKWEIAYRKKKKLIAEEKGSLSDSE